MRSPETARAIPELVSAGLLSPERAAPLLAAARGDLVSVRAELRTLAGLAVALLLVPCVMALWRRRPARQRPAPRPAA